MPKLKTKSSAKKRFSFTAKGKVKTTQACKRHNLSSSSQRSIRNQRGTTIMKETEAHFIRRFMPYDN